MKLIATKGQDVTPVGAEAAFPQLGPANATLVVHGKLAVGGARGQSRELVQIREQPGKETCGHLFGAMLGEEVLQLVGMVAT